MHPSSDSSSLTIAVLTNLSKILTGFAQVMLFSPPSRNDKIWNIIELIQEIKETLRRLSTEPLKIGLCFRNLTENRS